MSSFVLYRYRYVHTAADSLIFFRPSDLLQIGCFSICVKKEKKMQSCSFSIPCWKFSLHLGCVLNPSPVHGFTIVPVQ